MKIVTSMQCFGHERCTKIIAFAQIKANEEHHAVEPRDSAHIQVRLDLHHICTAVPKCRFLSLQLMT